MSPSDGAAAEAGALREALLRLRTTFHVELLVRGGVPREEAKQRGAAYRAALEVESGGRPAPVEPSALPVSESVRTMIRPAPSYSPGVLRSSITPAPPRPDAHAAYGKAADAAPQPAPPTPPPPIAPPTFIRRVAGTVAATLGLGRLFRR
ncbi:MAG TPA: hypothetical protein VED40_03860 [Azospirillaceae bacterium]|nr:hypothetical protein [Azospirillaceae bacterium]